MAQPPLAGRACTPCEGRVQPLPLSAAKALLQDVPGWSLVDLPAPRQRSVAGQAGGNALRRTVQCADFLGAVALIQQIAPIAEAQDHHPDLHLTHYRTLTIDVSTHAIGGLSEHDFILAAKINALLP